MFAETEFLEIFSWLPVKSIYKFSSLCKSLSQLPKEDFFAKKQSKNTQLAGDKYFLIQPYSCQSYKAGKLQLHSWLTSSTNDVLPVPYNSLQFIATTGSVLRSSNGLICVRNLSNHYEKSYFIFNPATKYWLQIPQPDRFDCGDTDFKIVFECNNVDDITDDYVLISVIGTSVWGSDPFCKIYSSRENIWKDAGRINIGAGRNICYETTVYQNGSIYLISDSGGYFREDSPFFWPYIVAYDVNNCVTKLLKLPKSSREGMDDLDYKLSIFTWKNLNNYLCLVKLNNNMFTIWVLTEEETSSWHQIFKMHVNTMGLNEFDLRVAGFTILNGNILLIATNSIVYRYDLSTRSSGRLQEVCHHECGENVIFHSFSSTLRPCGANATKLAA
ncbi:F-box protein [Forsythia ovata]|uniref:F-box protein n=1 Tax=Forsythia ovata TaxID=205694 RepID=A0ABD1WTI4_9LAMI